MPSIEPDDIRIPADVMPELKDQYVDCFYEATHGSGRLVLLDAGVPCADAEQVLRIAAEGVIGALAVPRGVMAHYVERYPNICYLMSMNVQVAPGRCSLQLCPIDDVLSLREVGINIVGVSYTVCLGAEHEAAMLSEAAELAADAHTNGLVAVLRICAEEGAEANAAALALALGADFVVLDEADADLAQTLKAAGPCGVLLADGCDEASEGLLERVHAQIEEGAAGCAIEATIAQHPLKTAVCLTKALSALALVDCDAQEALDVLQGIDDFVIEYD